MTHVRDIARLSPTEKKPRLRYYTAEEEDINRMGEKVILREQVKELFNKKYGQYKDNVKSFTLTIQTSSWLRRVYV